jgi:hypothetical protein
MTMGLAFTLSASFGVVSVLADTPSGEHIHGQSSIEPVYDDMTGAVAYVSTPIHVANPVKTNPRAWAPFYLPVYPTGSTVGTLDCMGIPGNCPDHDGLVAGAAMGLSAASGFGSVYAGGVIGHDHLMAGPGSGGDFNIAWQPVLVLFTNAKAANTHVTTLAQINALVASGDARLFVTGENGLPDLTFHCSVVPAVVYNNGTPVS